MEDGGWMAWLKAKWEGMLFMARMASLYRHTGLTTKHVQMVTQLMTWHRKSERKSEVLTWQISSTSGIPRVLFEYLLVNQWYRGLVCIYYYAH